MKYLFRPVFTRAEFILAFAVFFKWPGWWMYLGYVAAAAVLIHLEKRVYP